MAYSRLLRRTCRVIMHFFVTTHVSRHEHTLMAYSVLSRNGEESFNKIFSSDSDPDTCLRC